MDLSRKGALDVNGNKMITLVKLNLNPLKNALYLNINYVNCNGRNYNHYFFYAFDKCTLTISNAVRLITVNLPCLAS